MAGYLLVYINFIQICKYNNAPINILSLYLLSNKNKYNGPTNCSFRLVTVDPPVIFYTVYIYYTYTTTVYLNPSNYNTAIPNSKKITNLKISHMLLPTDSEQFYSQSTPSLLPNSFLMLLLKVFVRMYFESFQMR